jgi:hypothetical protein
MKNLLTIETLFAMVLLAGCEVLPAAGADSFGPLPDDTGMVTPPEDDGDESGLADAGEVSSTAGTDDTTSGGSTDGGSTGGGSTGGGSSGGELESGASTSSVSAESSSTGEPGVVEGLPEYSAVCSGGVLTTHGGDALDDPELVIVGVYEATSTDIDVSLDRPGPGVILVLSAYEPVHWVIDVAAGTDLQEVVLNGYNEHTVEGEGTAVVTDRSGIGIHLEACGYAYPDDGMGCDTDNLIAGAESLTGADLTGFGGCYSASSFTVD